MLKRQLFIAAAEAALRFRVLGTAALRTGRSSQKAVLLRLQVHFLHFSL